MFTATFNIPTFVTAVRLTQTQGSSDWETRHAGIHDVVAFVAVKGEMGAKVKGAKATAKAEWLLEIVL